MFGQRRVVPEEKKVELRNYQVHVHNIVLHYTTIKNWSNCKTGVKQGDHMYRALFSVFGISICYTSRRFTYSACQANYIIGTDLAENILIINTEKYKRMHCRIIKANFKKNFECLVRSNKVARGVKHLNVTLSGNSKE